MSLSVHSAPNLGVIFDSNLTFSQHISAVSKQCFYHIRDLRRIRYTITQITACIIATSLAHSKLDCYNSLLLNVPSIQTMHLQLVLNAAACAVTKTPKLHHIYPYLKLFTGSKLIRELKQCFLSHKKTALWSSFISLFSS
jgi:hypothetical protein